MKALQSIYTEDNFRIRSAKAQIGELKRQLRALDGDLTGTKAANGAEYPTIRQLPGLGVTYEDLYRRNKIADAVYEALVQQFEMSKIQEAKDTPKAQMLDVPERPEVKSFPPRVPIMMGCLALSLLFACGWVIAAEQWRAIEESDPGKRLVCEIAGAVQRHPIWSSKQVLKVRGVSGSMAQRWKRLAARRTESSYPAGAD
jgi:capsule polysaccharide export protein KpsE/RkpR